MTEVNTILGCASKILRWRILIWFFFSSCFGLGKWLLKCVQTVLIHSMYIIVHVQGLTVFSEIFPLPRREKNIRKELVCWKHLHNNVSA